MYVQTASQPLHTRACTRMCAPTQDTIHGILFQLRIRAEQPLHRLKISVACNLPIDPHQLPLFSWISWRCPLLCTLVIHWITHWLLLLFSFNTLMLLRSWGILLLRRFTHSLLSLVRAYINTLIWNLFYTLKGNWLWSVTGMPVSTAHWCFFSSPELHEYVSLSVLHVCHIRRREEYI